MTILANQISVKLFTRRAANQDLLIPIFHRWIREDLVAEHLLIDVADYRHVPRGPGIMLIANHAHLWMDEAEPGVGLIYARRRDPLGDLEVKVREALTWVAALGAQLEAEDGFAGVFDPSRVELQIRSRLSSAETFEEGRSALATVTDALAEEIWGPGSELEFGGDPRRPVTIRLRAANRFATATELAKAVAHERKARPSLSVLA
ncbi:MAG: hypothetical protein KJO07_12515 [Deltaproteobacteria bacterium]|nr:hypothetical protein [Deltaproteobacteria bacterium]